MAYVTIEKDGEPWMYCHSMQDADLEHQMSEERARAPSSTFTHRLSTPIESQHCSDAMDAESGLIEDTFKFFAVPVVDDLAA